MFFRFSIAAIILLFSSQSIAQVAFRCESCTTVQQNECARSYGNTLPLNSPTTVWVADFPNTTIRKFNIFKQNITLAPDEKGGASRASTFVNVIEDTLTPAEALESAKAAEFITDLLRPAGADISMPLCQNTRSADELKYDRNSNSRNGDQPLVVKQFNAPGSIAGSGFDVVGDSVLGNSVGLFIQTTDPATVYVGSLLDFADKLVNTTPNFSVVFLVTFDDGSSGVWEYDSLRQRLSANFSTFEDSEGNPIPFTLSDINGRTFMFSGTSNGGSNRMNMTGRINLLGGTINGSTEGGCSETVWQCNSQSCTVTCRTN